MAPLSLPRHTYHDLDVINSDYTSNSSPRLRLEETRNAPFLDGDSSAYFVSIIRFLHTNCELTPVIYTTN